jgi:hypothetical protein
MWESYDKCVHMRRCPVPLLQWIKVCPQGHDLHQLVEHGIGVIKGKFKLWLLSRVAGDIPLEEIQRMIVNACASFTLDSWVANVARLKVCCMIVGADKGAEVEFRYKDMLIKATGTGGGFPPKFVS